MAIFNNVLNDLVSKKLIVLKLAKLKRLSFLAIIVIICES